MKLKYSITLLFSTVVTGIMLLVCVSVFYFSSLNRERDFSKRLRNRALTTMNLLVKVKGIDKDLLKRIDETTLLAFQNKSLVIYDSTNNIIYSYADDKTPLLQLDKKVIDKAWKAGDYHYEQNKRDVVTVTYYDSFNRYLIVAAAFDNDGYEKLSQLKIILSSSFILGIIITFLSGLFFSLRITKPIKKITKEVHDISSQNLARRIAVHEPKDELYQLSATFNELLTRLQESFEMQKRFIANASHELSTPLTSILSQLEITLQNERGVNEYKNVLTSVHDDVRAMAQLTRSLLEIAKASGTSEGIDLSLLRADELLMKLPAELRQIDKRYTVELYFDSFPENENNLLVFGNPDLLYVAIKNLTINACKYSSSHIANVSLFFSENELCIAIEDDGPGIKQAEKHLVFQPFYRGTNTNDSNGFGLGLSLALHIAKLHKGTIEIADSNKSIFTIHLPVATQFYKL